MSHEKADETSRERFSKTNFWLYVIQQGRVGLSSIGMGKSTVEDAQSAETTAIKLIFPSIKASFNPSITIYAKLGRNRPHFSFCLITGLWCGCCKLIGSFITLSTWPITGNWECAGSVHKEKLIANQKIDDVVLISVVLEMNGSHNRKNIFVLNVELKKLFMSHKVS